MRINYDILIGGHLPLLSLVDPWKPEWDMDKYIIAIAISVGLLATTPVAAKVAGVTADGVWDCVDDSVGNVGAVVIVDKSYAFIKPNGGVGPYGKLFRTGEEQFDLPNFVVLDGYLKDEMAAVGISMNGPRENPHDLSGEHFLSVIITDTNQLYCTRRKAPSY